MGKHNTGSKNGMWKGGRVVAPSGYVLIRVGKAHHLADVRGYAYEHRLVAEATLGRRLRVGEQIHHRDGNRGNNAPDNLLVCASMADHKVHHRRRGSRLRLPREANAARKCACGCGQALLRYDSLGRPRQYLSGHNHREDPTQSAVLLALAKGPLSRQALSDRTGKTVRVVATTLSKLKRKGLVRQVARGIWQRKEVTHGSGD